MVSIVFARAFARHVACPKADVDAPTVAEALHAYFAAYPLVRSYVLDDQGAVRKHVAIFVNNDQLRDRITQTDMAVDGDTIYLFQALSGG